MQNERGIIKKSEMEAETNYLVCPEPGCELFFAERHTPCERDCPYESSLIKILKCHKCGNIMELPGNHSMTCRVECNCGAVTFNRMSGIYMRLERRPLDD